MATSATSLRGCRFLLLLHDLTGQVGMCSMGAESHTPGSGALPIARYRFMRWET